MDKSTEEELKPAYKILRLEQQLEAYERLHREEIEAIREDLRELRKMILQSDSGK
ncbi:MAG: hypothetical protein M1136_10860 [Chloroflexi bacterium]|nr:hypothetical protein [Chloroflexota bacterium]MCL5076126.1 hypothetical protein [Chloroflexota bacterium]